MKTFATFFLVILLVLFSACNQKTKAIPEKEQKLKVTDTIPQAETNSHESDTKRKVDLTSKLEEKIKRLSQLKHNYQVKSLEVVQPEKTMLIGSFERVLRLRDSILENIDIVTTKNNIHEIRKSFLKGTKPMQPNGNTYPRATVEEYIFKTTESAKVAYDMYIESKSDGRLWMYLSKAPYELFLEENRIYFMSSGGFYMMEIYKDIAEKIKN